MAEYNFREPRNKKPEFLVVRESPTLFPEIFSISKLKTNTLLPQLKISNLHNIINTRKKYVDISTVVPRLFKSVDLFLFLNKKKTDMYYQVPGGIYTFKEINLPKRKNLIELFYRIGREKSSSIYFEINRE